MNTFFFFAQVNPSVSDFSSSALLAMGEFSIFTLIPALLWILFPFIVWAKLNHLIRLQTETRNILLNQERSRAAQPSGKGTPASAP